LHDKTLQNKAVAVKSIWIVFSAGED
jgi:hypothetical protein